MGAAFRGPGLDSGHESTVGESHTQTDEEEQSKIKGVEEGVK